LLGRPDNFIAAAHASPFSALHAARANVFVTPADRAPVSSARLTAREREVLARIAAA